MPVTHQLLDLQALDIVIDRLRARDLALTGGAEQAAAREAADAAERELGELRLSIDELDRDAAKLEHEIDSLTQKSAAEQTRMSDGSVANARELESIGREVENLTRRTTDREDQLLTLMEQREAIERRAAAAEVTMGALRIRSDEVGAAADAELRQLTAELEAKTAERTDLAGGMDREVLELYEELRASKRGVGAAALVDGVCQGCHETLSAVELDRVKRAEGILRCEHCRRILVR